MALASTTLRGARFFDEYRPNNMNSLPEDDFTDRVVVTASTVKWWQSAHQDNTPYHQQFGRGYCPFCGS